MAKYAVRLLYDVPGWAYHRRCVALQKYAPDDFYVSIGGEYGKEFKKRRYDLVLQLCYACAKNIKDHVRRAGYDTLVVAGYNVSAGSGRNGWLKQCRKHADHVIINSADCWKATGQNPGTTWISNGVDRELFPRKVPAEKRKARVLSIGSRFHRKNKGFDKFLPEVEKRLKVKGITCDFRCINSHGGKARMTTEQLAAWYNTGTLYVVASENEGTPNPALEAASAGCVVVSTRVGNMPELIEPGVNGELVARDVKAFVQAVVKCQGRYIDMAAAMEARIAAWHWKERAAEYYALFRQMIDAHRAAN